MCLIFHHIFLSFSLQACSRHFCPTWWRECRDLQLSVFFLYIHLKGKVSLFVCIPSESSRRVLTCFSVTSGQVSHSRVNNAHVMWPRHACRAHTRSSPEGLNDNFNLFKSQFWKCVHWMTKFFGYYLPDGIVFFSPLSLCWNRKGATSAEFCSVITLPSSIKSANTPCVGSWWNGVITGLPFRLYQRCLWTGNVVGRGQTTVATAMAPFQRCTGKTERWRRQQRHGELWKLFYIIPRHNRADLSVCTHVHREERQLALHRLACFFKVHIRNISLDFPEYRFHRGEKIFWFQVHVCSILSHVLQL